MPLEFILFVLYLFLGPLIWAGYALATFAGRRRMMLMAEPEVPVKRRPKATILVPAKDEGARIRACIESCLAQDYEHFEVIAIDDRSTDETGRVMDELAAANPRLRVLHITEPPAAGWTGKNNALHQGTKIATGDWLLFVDSDVLLRPAALRVGLDVCIRRQFDMISLLPRIESYSNWEALLVPLCGAMAGSLHMIALNNTTTVEYNAFANGQFMLMSRAAYDKIGGHEAVRERLCEDVSIARFMKRRGLRPRMSWGNDYASVRMYSSFGDIYRGWSRIYYAAGMGRPWRMLIGAAFLLLCAFPAYAALAWGAYRLSHPASFFGVIPAAWSWLAAGGLHVGLMTCMLAVMYRWSGNRGRSALLFPITGPLLLAMLLRAARMCITKKVTWRGVSYSHSILDKPVVPSPQRSADA